MRNLVIFFTITLSSCCSSESKKLHGVGDNFNKFEMKSLIIDNGIEYHLIRDNLYYDKKGNIHLKSTDVSSADTGDPDKNWEATKIRWIGEVYCDTIPQDKGIPALRSVVDTATFSLDYTVLEQGADFYKDKNHTYFHKWMADGGTLSLLD